MTEETLKTLSSCSFFVFLFGTSGFLVTVILNTTRAYIETSSNQMNEVWVTTQLFATNYIPYYFLIGVIFAGLGLFLIYNLRHNST